MRNLRNTDWPFPLLFNDIFRLFYISHDLSNMGWNQINDATMQNRVSLVETKRDKQIRASRTVDDN